MNGLLPQDFIVDLLEESGAYGSDKASHIIRSVTNFKPLKIQQKNQSDINLNLFEETFDRFLEIIQKDFKKNFLESGQFTRRPGVINPLKKLKAREGSFSIALQHAELREPLLIFVSSTLFFSILNFYLGGVGVKSEKTSAKLTDIEKSVLQQIGQSLNDLVTQSLEPVAKFNFDLSDVDLSDDQMSDQLKNDFWCVEVVLNQGGQKSNLTIALPLTFLKLVKKTLDNQDESQQAKPDPLWQKVVTETVFNSEVDLRINMGEFVLPFEKSLNLKVGDVFEWEKYGQQVVVSFLERPRMVATIGAVGEHYAIRVEDRME